MERSAHAWRTQGNAYYDAQRWDEAAQALERSLALEPECVDAWYRLGNVRQEQGREQKAMECFERVVALDPTHARAWNNFGVSREKLGHETLAAEAYRHAVENAPSLLQALLNLAHITLRLGDAESAVKLLERATSLDPSNFDTWETLARVQLRLGRTAEANEAYRTAMDKLLPRVQPILNEAELARAHGDYVTMEKCLAAVLEYVPDNPTLRHLITAARGETTARASQAYVSALFDGFAKEYDRSMLENLEYRVPDLLAKVVMPMLQRACPVHVIDLGCGTGLLGAALANTRANIVGIDLSERMLKQAALRGAYARLVKGDLVEELERVPAATVDAILAADVFVYLGDLQLVFAAAARALVPGGTFAFTVEALDEGNFQLRPSGRYAHSSGYIRGLAAQSRLNEHSMERIRARREGESYTEAWLACFVVPGARG